MRSSSKAFVTFTIILLIVGCFYFVVIYRMSTDRFVELGDEDPLVIAYSNLEIPMNPASEYWNNIESSNIHLYPQTVRIPFGTEERDIWVKGTFNDIEIAFLLEIEDETENRGFPTKPDACAILLVPSNSPATAQMMGHVSHANIWQWLAGQDSMKTQDEKESRQVVRELVASGPGTQAPMISQNVEGKGVFKDGKWTVVFKRMLNSRQEGEMELKPGNDWKISFAVWDGAKMESFSKKSISILRNLILENI